VIFEIDDKFVIKRRLDSSFYRQFLRIESHVVCGIHDEVAKMLDNEICDLLNVISFRSIIYLSQMDS
jgi:hypothetical protein